MLRHLIGKLGKNLTALGLVLGIGVGTASASALADIVYGVDDEGHVWSVNTATGAQDQLTTLPTGTGANGLAFDGLNKTLYFRLPQNGQMYSYVLGSGATASALAVTGLGGTDSSSAAFYGTSYYFVNQGTSDLYAADMTGGTPNFTKIASFTDAGGTSLGPLNFGDIAISRSGELYMSTYTTDKTQTKFYKANLNAILGDDTVVATLLGTNTAPASLQLTFQADGALIGQNHGDGLWYTVSTSDGTATLLAGIPNTPMFRDLAGSAVPEPSSIAMMGLGVAAALGFARRRMQAHA